MPSIRSSLPILLLAFFIGSPVGLAQTTNGESDDDFTVRDGNAGYIDLAIPGNQIRLIFDAGYDIIRPTRNEFFYAPAQPIGPGLPLAESSVDYQEASIYMEQLLAEKVSVFVQVGMRSLNPEVNDNSSGPGDLGLGVKAALISSPDLVLSGQLRAWLPTGDSDLGLGTNHASVEPGLLLFAPLDEKSAVLGELRYWIPIDGAGFDGPVLRYGLGAQYELYRSCSTKIVPVVELVGWTAFAGQAASPAPIIGQIEDADGDTILNLKAGTRIGLGRNMDLYGGYGHSLTGDRWYRDILRFELRYMF